MPMDRSKYPAAPPDDDDAILTLLQDPETRFWNGACALWEYGAEYQPLAADAERLADWLPRAERWLAAHPDHPEIAERRTRYRDASERLAACKTGMADIDHEVWLIHNALSTVWRRIPEKRRKAMQSHPGFPRAHMPAQVVGELWVMSKARRPIAGLAPF